MNITDRETHTFDLITLTVDALDTPASIATDLDTALAPVLARGIHRQVRVTDPYWRDKTPTGTNPVASLILPEAEHPLFTGDQIIVNGWDGTITIDGSTGPRG